MANKMRDLDERSHLYTTTGKTTALTRQTFVGKVMSLLFNMLSRLVTAFLPRRKHLLISWLQSPSAVILGSKEIKSVTASIVSPSICHEMMGLDAMILVWMWELNYKESWTQKNWCFWTVVLEKTLESPLDCKESKPVHPKGDQSWVFIGRTAAEAETPILWPPHAKSQLIGKDPDGGRVWGQEKGTIEDEMAGWHHQLDGHVWVNSRNWWLTGRPGMLRFMGSQRVRHDWATELNWSKLGGLVSLHEFYLLDKKGGIWKHIFLQKRNTDKHQKTVESDTYLADWEVAQKGMSDTSLVYFLYSSYV